MGGGAERSMVILANGLISRGISVDMVLSKAEGPYLIDLDPKIQVIDLKSKRLTFSIIPLVKYIKKEKPQVMLSALNSANIIALIARMISRLSFRLVVSERAATSIALADNPLLRTNLIPFLMRSTYRKADEIIVVSSGVKRDLIENIGISGTKISVVYNPVVTDNLIELSNKTVKHEWLENSDIPVILSAGRLNSQKNYPLLMNAFSLLLEVRDARLIILGEGALREDLEGLARDLKISKKVDLPGFVNNPYAWFRKANLFVLSSDYEGLPGALIQAMACGTPVVSTDCPSGPSEILEAGKWGRLVPMNDKFALFMAMRDTLNEKINPEVLKRAQFFNVDNGLDGYQKILGLSGNSVLVDL